MLRYISWRLVQVPLVLVVVTLTVFLVTRATPGDPVQIMLGMQTSPEAVAAIRREFNLDRSLPMQYLLWVGKLLTGDLGRSIRLNDEVTTLLRHLGPGKCVFITTGWQQFNLTVRPDLRVPRVEPSEDPRAAGSRSPSRS